MLDYKSAAYNQLKPAGSRVIDVNRCECGKLWSWSENVIKMPTSVSALVIDSAQAGREAVRKVITACRMLSRHNLPLLNRRARARTPRQQTGGGEWAKL